MTVKGKPVGSALIGQQFTSPGNFWGRPSATLPYPNNAAVSSGSNLGPLNPALTDAVKDALGAQRRRPGKRPAGADRSGDRSGSGLDPDISLAAAYYQATRVAKTRQLPVEQVKTLIEQHAERPWLGIFGEPRVNVLNSTSRSKLAMSEK